jgi:hypothetical protein
MSGNNRWKNIVEKTNHWITLSRWCLFEDHVFDPSKQTWIKKQEQSRVCLHSKCPRQHRLQRPTKICSRENDCPNAGITCFLLHDNNKIAPLCRHGDKCCDADCKYRHSLKRSKETCNKGRDCTEAGLTCFNLHPLSDMVPRCKYGAYCQSYICEARHPKERKELCPEGSNCWYHLKKLAGGGQVCNKIHPKILGRLCRWDDTFIGCRTFGCAFIHSPESAQDCPEGLYCDLKNNVEHNKKWKHPLEF